MNIYELNYHKIKFALELISSPEEKLSYLYQIKIEINRVIQCFTKKKFLPLRKYAMDNIFLEDGCPELNKFMKQLLAFYDSRPNEQRYPNEDILLRHIKKEIKKYERLGKLIDAEIDYFTKRRDQKINISQNESNIKQGNKNISEKLKLSETETMEELEKKNKVDQARKEVAKNTTSIRELKEQQKKIVWQGSQTELIYFFDQLYDMDFMSIKSYDEIFAIISKFFVDKDGQPFRTDKVAEMKLQQRKSSMPKGYARYMKVIDKLKAKGSGNPNL